ncbi:site-specific DNA-methyltransferase [Marimonas arenosa]|uniref:site-specific DNA-methyltransferase (adenine-specific) n=1 Tax=Marimonas arenosa TaxID=1795305 RepID=A0AAE3WEB7_9RHOB|nr:site-specific DNA-methyltransferase [Marimonas arenosa]MDQ2091152.1 site-specific DNA-methyltransferase [Marimonas arenosa]
MAKKRKLELTWVGKESRPRLEPRILIEHPDKSYHADIRHSADDNFDNILIKGDNLLALKALEQEYAGRIKCIFIDPPYNTGNAFDGFYDDGLEHSIWLSLMKDRIEILWSLLSDDGSLWVVLDDEEAHYFKVMCDEIFGRRQFISKVIWKHSDNSNNNALKFSQDHNYLIVYAKDQSWRPKFLNDPEKRKHFKNPDNDPRGPWFDGNPLNNPALRPNLQYTVTSPTGYEIPHPPNGWRWSKETLQEKIRSGEIRFTEDGKGLRRRTYLADMKGLPPSTMWIDIEKTGHTRQAKYELKKLFPDVPVTSLFPTPKPERLIKTVLELATEPDDIVLDSFAGSGTTGAVAHKMNRRWIMVEIGEHADTHIAPRLSKVIDGQDDGGVTSLMEWKGGGGFRYYTLAPSLIETDRFGMQVISKEYNAEMLAEAMCKHMGFTYAPSEADYWSHGYSTETDFIYVTTQSLTHDTLRKISEDVGPDRTLMICCKAFSGDGKFDNLTVHKIPGIILNKCEWGRDDYSLNVQNLPMAEQEDPNADLPLFSAEEQNDG